jgi:hypothetical protein
LLELLFIKGGEKALIAFVDDHCCVRPGDHFAAVKTWTFTLLCTYDFAATQTIVNQFVFLGYAIALDPVEIDLSWLATLLFFHFLLK